MLGFALLPLLVAISVTSSGLAAPLAHTCSIVARDSVTGELGVAVQSHYFSVGPVVPWEDAGDNFISDKKFPEAMVAYEAAMKLAPEGLDRPAVSGAAAGAGALR